MHWYVVHTKPRREKTALHNLEQQGYECYFPTLAVEKLLHGRRVTIAEPLFPRYLFIRLGQGVSAKSWAPIRSTKGVGQLVKFGAEPANVDDAVIELLRTKAALMHSGPEPLFKCGERIRVMEAPFSGIEGVYLMADGECRAMVLIELLSKPTKLRVHTASLRKTG